MLIFGLSLGLLGFLSLIISITMMVGSFYDINDPVGRIYFTIIKFIIGELLLAFGVAVSLLGLRCVCGPRKWIVKTINFMWKRTVSITFIFGYVMFATIIILLLIKFFSSLI